MKRIILGKKIVIISLTLLLCFGLVMAAKVRNYHKTNKPENKILILSASQPNNNVEIFADSFTGTDNTSNRFKVSGSAHTSGDAARQHFSGKADLEINGVNRRANFTLTLQESISDMNSGNKVASVLCRFDFEDGGSSVTTSGSLNIVAVESSEMLNLVSVMAVTDGTGVYAGGRGQLELNGNMNSHQSDISWVIKGIIEN